MSIPSTETVTGEIISGLDFDGRTTIYKIKVDCPFCSKSHTHGLGSKPMKYDKTTRISDCTEKSYTLDVSNSMK